MKRQLQFSFIIVLTVVMVAALSGCHSTTYVPIETVKHDSIYLTRLLSDTLLKTDSVYIREKNDTVLIEKYKYIYRSKLVRDTMYIEKRDTISVPYPVEAKLTTWQKMRLRLFNAVLGILIAAGVAVAIYIIVKVRNAKK